jgi:putative zinc finger/helix-turn-helix YgiT family protein
MKNNVISFPAAETRYCAQCGEFSARLSFQDEQFAYGVGKDQVILTANVPVWTCEACEAQYTDGDAEDIRHAEICRHLGRLTPPEVRAIRERHELSQQEWSARTGFGVASVKRWETGGLIQNEAADRFMRLLVYEDVFVKLTLLNKSSAPSTNIYRFRTALPETVVKSAALFVLRKANR